MITTVSSTHGFASWAAERTRAGCRALRLLVLGLFLAAGLDAARATDLASLRTERADEGIYLSANLSFELPPPVEDALLKGIALIFVVEAEIYRDRWYWTDKLVAQASRSLRLAYQPLTRRWRVSLGSDPGGVGRVALAQTYDSLPEALGAIKRVSRWRVAESGDIDGSSHALTFRFRLDQGALPRPFQIGIAGQREWQIALERKQRLRLERSVPDTPAVDK